MLIMKTQIYCVIAKRKPTSLPLRNGSPLARFTERAYFASLPQLLPRIPR